MHSRLLALLIPAATPFLLCAQQTEVEPNESYAAATDWTYGLTMSGSECNPTVGTDYFRLVLPSDGVITFTVTSQGSGPDPGELQFALFPKSGFYQQYHVLPGSSVPSVITFSHSCLSGDTMYVRIQSGAVPIGNNSCINYSMGFTVQPAVFSNDTGNNDDITNAQPVAWGADQDGHLSFLYDQSADWYSVALPEDGTIRIIAASENADAVATGTLQLYSAVSNTSFTPLIGASGVSNVDTFFVACVGAQTASFRIQPGNSDACGISYRVRFDLVAGAFANDLLPNDDFSNPQPVTLNTPIEGHLAFIGDNSQDIYGLVLPDDGTLLIITEAEQFSAVTTSTMEIYVDQTNSYSNAPIGTSSVAALDTFTVQCVRAGPITVRLQNSGSGCGIGYRARFELQPPQFVGDAEPNDGFGTGTFVAPDSDHSGHLGHIGTVNDDFFRLEKPFAGTMRIIVQSLFGGTAPVLNASVYSSANAFLVGTSLTTGAQGVTATDTIDVYTAAPDTLKLRLNLSGGDCGSYRFRYLGSEVGIAEGSVNAWPVTAAPNPSPDGRFTLTTGGLPVTRLQVMDLSGRTLRDERLNNAGGAIALDLSDLPAGSYIGRLLNHEGRWAAVRLVRTR